MSTSMSTSLGVLDSANVADVAASCAALGLSVDEFHDLHRQSRTAADSAYCPYSNFPVGAALLAAGTATTPGRVILGANVENAAYPVGTCAERIALGSAVFAGHRDFKAIAVLAPAAPGEMPCSPCGMCRQFIREFCDLKMPVLMFAENGSYIAVKLEAVRWAMGDSRRQVPMIRRHTVHC